MDKLDLPNPDPRSISAGCLPANQEGLAQLLDAVADPVRLSLIFLLGQLGPLHVNEIAGHFSLSRPAISHHLKVLKQAGLVHGKKEGQEVAYTVDRAKIVQILRALADAIDTCCP